MTGVRNGNDGAKNVIRKIYRIGIACVLLIVLFISPQILVQVATSMEDPVPEGLYPWNLAVDFNLAVDSSNNIWFGANGPYFELEGYIVKYDMMLQTFTNYSLPTSPVGPILGAAVDLNGNVWVCERDANKVARLNVSTGIIDEFDIASPEDPNPRPRSIAVDLSNNIWIGCESNKIVKFTPPATFVNYHFPSAYWDSVAHNIKVKDGIVWFTDSINPYLGNLDPSTGSFMFYGPLTSHTLFLDLDSKGNVWFSENSANVIGVYNVADETLTEYFVPTPGEDTPYGVAVDVDDNVWFAESENKKIGMLDTDTKKFTEYNVASQPYDLARNLIGDIWYIGRGEGSWYLGCLEPTEPSKTSEASDPTRYVRRWGSELETTVCCRSRVAVGEEFTLKVIIKNIASGPISGVSISLHLRKGMVLRSDETATVSIGTLDAGKLTIIKWHLTANKQGNYLTKLHASGVLPDGSSEFIRVFWMIEAKK